VAPSFLSPLYGHGRTACTWCPLPIRFFSGELRLNMPSNGRACRVRARQPCVRQRDANAAQQRVQHAVRQGQHTRFCASALACVSSAVYASVLRPCAECAQRGQVGRGRGRPTLGEGGGADLRSLARSFRAVLASRLRSLIFSTCQV